MKKTAISRVKSAKKSVAKSVVDSFDTSKDLRSAVLVLSLLANIFALCLWITLQITDKYDQSLIEFFIQR